MQILFPAVDWSKPLSPDINDYCFADTETRSVDGAGAAGDLRNTSTRNYAKHAKVVIFTFAIGDGEVEDWVLEDFDGTLDWGNAPPKLRAFRQKSASGKGWFVFHNAGFDRNVCEFGIDGHPLSVTEIIDNIVQCSASNLPNGLDAVSKATGGRGKLPDGKALIKLFCFEGGATPQSHPEEWKTFREYARIDVDEMRHAWKHTLPLPAWQWREYWASEVINDRGLPIDVDFVRKAAALAEDYKDLLKERLTEITGGEIHSPHQHAKIATWVWDRVEEVPGARDAMVKTYDEDTEGGEMIPTSIGLDRPRVKRLLALLDRHNEEVGLTDDEEAVRLLLVEKEYGASAAPGKFKKMLECMVDVSNHDPYPSVPSQYVFNGAQQTGRFSSRGVQVHNMTRKVLGNEEDVLLAILDGISVIDLEKLAGNAGKALSLTVRPAIMADPGYVLMWGDSANIEARVLPWLARAEHRLDLFRRVDADKKQPDVYTVSAAGMERLDVDKLWHDYKVLQLPEAATIRQKGKVAELALGFGGASGALHNMASVYGLAFTDEEAGEIVGKWRASNQWAKKFWDECWEAFTSAATRPGEAFVAGRVVYLGVPNYLGAVTVQCYLPDGRTLTYRNVKFEQRNVKNPKTGKSEVRSQYTYSGQHTRKALWYGILVENITQAVAASLLRWWIATLLFEEKQDVRAHTHDEIVLQVPDNDGAIKTTHATLAKVLRTQPEWAEGLPLNCDIETNSYYTKAG